MNPYTGQVVADITMVPEVMRGQLLPLPKHLWGEAQRALAGRPEAHVSLNRRKGLAAWARKERQRRRAKNKVARASRKRNRAA